MSVNRKFLWDSINARPGKRWVLALGLAVTPWFAAAGWAENFNLDSVDFATTGDQTRITLRTGSIVPVQKVMTSSDKLILDIEQINAQDTIRTSFAKAKNISHVIMQPINEHKIRLIIRGENLAAPTIAFDNPTTGTQVSANPGFSREKLHQETQSALRQIETSGALSVATAPEASSLPAAKAPSAKPEAKSGAKAEAAEPADTMLPFSAVGEEESIAFGGLTNQTNTEALSPAATDVKPALTGLPEKMKPLNLPTLELPSGGNELLEKVKGGQYNNYLLGGLLALLALGVGGFVIHRIMRLKQVEPDLEALLLEQHNGKKVSFREMASAYRTRHDQGVKPELASKSFGHKKNAEDVIGLRSLNQLEPDVPTEQAAPAPKKMAQKPGPAKGRPQPAQAPANPALEPFGGQTPSMEQLIAMVQAVSEPKRAAQEPIKTPAPKQAVNQYMKANAGKPQPQARTNEPLNETMVKEVKRAQALQQELMQQAQQQIADAQANRLQPKAAPVNRAAAAQKAVKPVNFKNAPATSPVNAKRPASPTPRPQNATAAGKNGPLPGNPEVLNFLRNVADLMEKDGKPQIANSINKNLNPGRP